MVAAAAVEKKRWPREPTDACNFSQPNVIFYSVKRMRFLIDILRDMVNYQS